MYFLWFTVALIASVSSVPIIPSESQPEPGLAVSHVTEVLNISLETLDSINVENLHKAINSSNPNAKIVTSILISTTAEEQKRLNEKYQTTYHTSLIKDLENTFSGKFGEALIAFMTPLNEYYAKEISKSIHSNDPQQSALIDSLCIFDRYLLNKIIEVYPKYADGKSLEDDLKVLQPENFKKLMNSCLLQSRDNSTVNNNVPLESLEEDELINYMSQRSHEQISQLTLSYKNMTGNKLEDVLREQYEGKFQRALIVIIKYSLSEKLYFVKRLHESLSGPEVDYASLLHLALMNRTVSSQKICSFYTKLYKEDLTDTIEREIPAGTYRFLFVNLLAKKKPLQVTTDQILDEL